jgi:uncharacterized membrane protein YoaK (UPF0700 family)
MLSGYLVDIRLKLHKKPQYFVTFGIIFFLILVILLGGLLGFFGQFGSPLEDTANFSLVILLCLVCGIQNGTITTVSRSVVRTTHLTGITTDLGIGLVRYLHRRQISEGVFDESKAILMRLGIILWFGLGSVVGAFSFRSLEYWGFAIPLVTSGGLFLVMLYYQVFKLHQERRD